jgi:hypothetical protein
MHTAYVQDMLLYPDGLTRRLLKYYWLNRSRDRGDNFKLHVPLTRCASEHRVLHPSGCLAILLARVTALCFLSSAFEIERSRFSQFNFQKENREIVIYSLNQLVFVLKFPSLQSSFNLTRHKLCKIDLQVGLIIQNSEVNNV